MVAERDDEYTLGGLPGVDWDQWRDDMPAGTRAFLGILGEIQSLHLKKGADYGAADDVFSNVRASEDFGVSGWIGTLIRANDKVKRLQTAAVRGSLANESVEDSLIDLAAYAVIALALYREEQE